MKRATHAQMQKVAIVDTYVRDLVYHAWGEGEWSDELRHHVWRSRCGVQIAVAFGAILRREHAAAIARPCRRCYRDEELER